VIKLIALVLSAALAGAAAAAGVPKTIQDCALCGVLRVIPAGSFIMGSPPTEEGRTIGSGAPDGVGDPNRELQHRVTIAKPFALGEFLVTKGEYAAFVRATGYHPVNQCFSSTHAGPGGFMSDKFTWDHPGFFTQGDNEPVLCVSAIDALAYLDWLSAKTGKHYRLPTEAEWEYAARAGTTTSRYWGDDKNQSCTYANVIGTEAKKIFNGAPVNCDDHYVDTSPVGTYNPNAFGLYDMIGNLWEVVADCWHPSYAGAPADGSAWGEEPNCKASTLRGGSFVSNYTSDRSAARHEAWPSAQFFNYGFRVARDLR